MRSFFAGLLLLLALPAFAADDRITVRSLTVELPGQDVQVAQAELNRQWFLSWGLERREVVLQPVNPVGKRLPPRTFENCTIARSSGLTDGVIAALALSCQR